MDRNGRPTPRSVAGGGIILTLALLVGAVVGIRMGEPSAGLLIGLGVGGLGALLFNRVNARKRDG
ncbi:MAG: hypothetical protein RQ833_07185 [Sphingomonadaceae bacterium]|nr:hypothetical protein [Sphingomonadaceae bacterium]